MPIGFFCVLSGDTSTNGQEGLGVKQLTLMLIDNCSIN